MLTRRQNSYKNETKGTNLTQEDINYNQLSSSFLSHKRGSYDGYKSSALDIINVGSSGNIHAIFNILIFLLIILTTFRCDSL
jgi:hypothetical protein